jgi:hypothetical protein
MIRTFHNKRLWLPLVMTAMLVYGGCKPPAPPLSPGAAAFKQETKLAQERLTMSLVDPVSRGDRAGVAAALQQIMPEGIKLCRMCPFLLGVLDKNGVILSTYPSKEKYRKDFSDYQVVVKALADRKVCQSRLYLPDGSLLFVICTPLMQGEEAVGALILTSLAEEVKKRWGITEQEFYDIDFN